MQADQIGRISRHIEEFPTCRSPKICHAAAVADHEDAALLLLSAARERGFGVMTGCMISSSLAIAPAFHIAARSDFADLDGPLWLAEDHPGGVRLEDGKLRGPSLALWGGGPG